MTSILWDKYYPHFTNEKQRPREAKILPFGYTSEQGLTQTHILSLALPQERMHRKASQPPFQSITLRREDQGDAAGPVPPPGGRPCDVQLP